MNNWNTKTLGNSKLVLHCGAELIEEDALRTLAPPPATDSHFPVPYINFLEDTRLALREAGFSIGDSIHSTSHEHQRYFGIMSAHIPNPADAEQSVFDHVVGLRSSWDKSFSLQLALGSRVFVCDNLAFNGEVVIRRKNTRHAIDQLGTLCIKAVDRVKAHQANEEHRAEKYMGTLMPRKDACERLIYCIQNGAIGGGKAVKVIDQFENPAHEEHLNDRGDHTVWTLKQAFTEVFKEYSLASLPERSRVINHCLDKAAGYNPLVLDVEEVS